MHRLCASFPQTPLSLQILSSHDHKTTDKLLLPSPCPKTRQKNISKWLISATDREPNFEVDQEKARQALNELDLQFESISKKQINPPKIKASILGDFKTQMREEPPEIPGSIFESVAFVLLAFSICYNILFLTVIKPAVDGPDDNVAANATKTEVSAERQP